MSGEVGARGKVQCGFGEAVVQWICYKGDLRARSEKRPLDTASEHLRSSVSKNCDKEW